MHLACNYARYYARDGDLISSAQFNNNRLEITPIDATAPSLPPADY